MKRIIYSLLLVVGTGLTSCNYLNMSSYFEDFLPADSIVQSEQYMKGYLYGAASWLPNEGNLLVNSYGPYGVANDETLLPWNPRNDYAGIAFSINEMDPFANHFNVYPTYYKGIRASNKILTNYQRIPHLSTRGKDEILGLTHFMRAMFYYRLLELYGPVPLLPEEELDVDKSSEDLAFPRSTYDQVVDYICKDLDEAYKYLPEENPSSMIYRPTRYAAMAFKNRILLTAASSWYNGNPVYASWKTAEGENFISQVYEPEKWAYSAAAAKVIIESDRFELYTFPSDQFTPELPENVSKLPYPDGAGEIDPYRSYSHMFNGEALDQRNSELIYAATFNQQDLKNVFPLNANGWNSWGVTQELVDKYRMKDGSDFKVTDDSHQPIGGDRTFSEYTLKGDAPKMYLDREPRFYATIGFNHWLLVGSSYTDSGKDNYRNSVNREVTYYSDGNAIPGNANPDDRIRTGYTCVKYLHPEDNFFATVKRKTFPAMRYAETLLNYVEALNEMRGEPAYTYTTPDSLTTVTVQYDPEEIVKYFNRIRYRAGLPGITVDDVADQNAFRELLRRERAVEFAQEGRRYHDVRRWGIANETENKHLRGLDVSKRKNQRKEFYTPIEIQHKNAIRIFTPKMYFFPLPRTAMDKNPKLIQNPGWDNRGDWAE